MIGYVALRNGHPKISDLVAFSAPLKSSSVYANADVKFPILQNPNSFQTTTVITRPKSDDRPIVIAAGLGLLGGLAYILGSPITVPLSLLGGGALLLSGCGDEESGLSIGMERVSVGAGGVEGNGESSSPSISADGRYVKFKSEANNLVPGDRNGKEDIFIRDRLNGETLLIDDDSDNRSLLITVDGRYEADNEPSAGSGLGAEVDKIFVRDRETGRKKKINIDPEIAKLLGTIYLNGVSADGRHVLFKAYTRYPYPEKNGEPCPWDRYRNSCDGVEIMEIFIHDQQTGVTKPVSVGVDGVIGNNWSDRSSMSATGRFVVFNSGADNLVPGFSDNIWNLYVRDIQEETTERLDIDIGFGEARHWVEAFISTDGRYIAFDTDADTVVLDDTNDSSDVFVHDRQTRITKRVSVGSGNIEANSHSGEALISADGRFVTFESTADNLVPNDTNGYKDVFVVGVERFF